VAIALTATQTQLWTGARIATGFGRSAAVIDAAALVILGEHLAWVGPMAELPEVYRALPTIDFCGRWVLPAFVDCHTHLVWGGSRFHEFEQRQQGASYEDIARAGGGIRATVAATRAADADALLHAALPRARALLAEGVTTIEIKSGYGLDTANELKMLRVARQVGDLLGVDVRTSFLGAHAVSPEFAGRADDYIDYLCTKVLPVCAAGGFVDAVDAFCERIAFSPAQVERLFARAAALGLPVKLHAEQLSDSKGTQLAARLGALSCDHLEWVSEAGVQAMAQAGTVAVLLPGAFYFLRETRKPPIDLFRRYDVPMAVATDLNPGSSPIASLLTVLHMSGIHFGLTPGEALAAVTDNAARALGCDDRGRLAPGKLASFTVWDFTDPRELAYGLGMHRPTRVVHRGRELWKPGSVQTPAPAPPFPELSFPIFPS